MTTETEWGAVQQCEFAALITTENFSMAWDQFVGSCSNESTAIGLVIAVVSALITLVGVLIKLYLSFIKPKPESEKYKSDLAYYQKTLHPSKFAGRELSLAEEELYAKAMELHNEIETYRSRNRIRIAELRLNQGLNKLRIFFGEQAIQRNPSQSKSSVQQASTLFAQLLSEGSYKFCLTLAFVYPLLFALINGLISNEVALAQFTLFKFDSNSGKVWFVAGIVFAFALFWLGNKLDAKGGGWRLIAALCYLVAVALVGAGAVAGALVGAVAVAGALVGAVAVAGAFAMFLLNRLQKNERLPALKRQGYFVLVALLYLSACCLLVVKFAEPSKLEMVLIPILLGILPLLNAPIDWLSLNFTRALSYLIADHHGKKRFLLGFLLVDIVGALVFMGLIIAVMLGVLSLANAASYFVAEKPILNFNQIMPAMISADTASQYIWAHFMVLSTLIPTLLHLILMMVSVVLYPFGHAKKAMYDNFYQNQQHYAPIVMRHQQTKQAQAMGLGAVVLVVAAVAIMNFSWAGCGLWHYADWVLSIIDSGYVSPVGGDLLCF